MNYIVNLGGFNYGPFTSAQAAGLWASARMQRGENALGGYSILQLRAPAEMPSEQDSMLDANATHWFTAPR